MSFAANLLHEAAQIVAGARNATHGDKERSFDLIARFWTDYLAGRTHVPHGTTTTIRAQDVAQMMVLLKVARSIQGKSVRDHYVDQAGYSAIAAELARVESAPTPVPAPSPPSPAPAPLSDAPWRDIAPWRVQARIHAAAAAAAEREQAQRREMRTLDAQRAAQRDARPWPPLPPTASPIGPFVPPEPEPIHPPRAEPPPDPFFNSSWMTLRGLPRDVPPPPSSPDRK